MKAKIQRFLKKKYQNVANLVKMYRILKKKFEK